MWPWPVRSSARTTSPGPKRRVVPSPIPISICPMRIKCIVAGARCASRSNSPQGNSGTRGWHPPEVQCCGSPRPAEGDLQNGSGRRGPYISVRSCACSFPQRDHRARKGMLRVIADGETSGILAQHASTGMSRFLHAGRPLSPLQRSFPCARKRPARAAKRPKLLLIAQDKLGLSRRDLLQNGQAFGCPGSNRPRISIPVVDDGL